MLKTRILFQVLVLALFSSITTSKTLDEQSLNIKKSPNDERVYDFVQLSNKLRVLLISDPSTDKSSASLDVNVGSATDPEDYPGLAHFLEHMLFLGTQKYPEADAYQKFIRQHGGSHNAYTSPENTNYFFDVRPEYLEGALDRFSEQFTHPLFNAEYVQREVNAVHSEYTSKLKDDGRRFYSVLKAIMSDDHPYGDFSVGNLDTLMSNGEEQLRNELLEFYGKYYSANQMTLVILGKEPLSTLRSWAISKFSDIKNTDINIDDFDQDFFDPSFLPSKVEVQSIMDKRSMMLAFPIPSSSLHPKSKPVSYLSNLIGHEGEGSLLSALKQETLVDSLSAGAEFDTRVNELFVIRMHLTKKGYENQERILEIIFSYVDLLKSQDLRRMYFDEQKTMLDISFNYQEKSEPIHFTSHVARALQYTDAQEVLVEPYVLTEFNKTLYGKYLDLLSPEKMLLTVKAKDIKGDMTTQWYETPYRVSKLDEKLISKLKSPSKVSSLKLPAKNIFIPEDTSIVGTPNTAKPELLLKRQGLEVWHHTDTSFRTPKANLFLTIRSPEATHSAETLNMTELMVNLLMDSLSEYSYPAYLAGLNYELYNHMRGVTIKVSGYSDQQTELLARILSTVKYKTFKQDRFAVMKERLSRKLSNAKDRKPFQQTISKVQNTLITPSWDEEERLKALEGTQLEDVADFRQRFLSNLDIAVLSTGNLSRTTTLNNVQLIDSFLLKEANKTTVERAKIKQLPTNTNLLNEFDIAHSDTGFVHYVQGADTHYTERAKYMLLTQMLASDYYNQIRTEQQLGYIVFATSLELLEVPGLAFIVQSPTASGATLLQETYNFLDKASSKLSKTSEADLNKHKSSVIANLLKQDNTLYARSNVYWKDVDIKNADFDSKQRLAEEVGKLKLDDLEKLAASISSRKHGTLTVFTKPETGASEEKGDQPSPLNNTKAITKELLEKLPTFQ